MKTFTMKTLLVAVALVTAAPALADTDEASMQVYRYVYSPERAIGSWDHAVEIARNDIRNETASDIKSRSMMDLYDTAALLQTQYGYALYVPERVKPLVWKKIV
ncbi:hypothetical protein [Pseudidiomarina sp.]|uniref:hypothetical protein n=1 Tax=Pseudidiomarina sp. TaxID=2081707 RepID=UPI003A973C88